MTQTHFQRGGNSHKRINRNIFFTAFDLADVIVVKSRLFSQLFLAPFHAPATRSDVFTQDFSMFRSFHDSLKDPKPHLWTTVYTRYFILAFYRRVFDGHPV